MTPMKFVKQHIDEFKGLIGDTFAERYHNKAEPNGFYDETNDIRYPKAGIESDFIRLLKVKIKPGHTYSIGFAFNYIDKKIEESSVRLSLKIGSPNVKDDQFLCSNELSIADFKDKMKALNKGLSLCGNQLDYQTILESLASQFFEPQSNHKRVNLDLSSPNLKKRVCAIDVAQEM
jgi:hypothetical protein